MWKELGVERDGETRFEVHRFGAACKDARGDHIWRCHRRQIAAGLPHHRRLMRGGVRGALISAILPSFSAEILRPARIRDA